MEYIVYRPKNYSRDSLDCFYYYDDGIEIVILEKFKSKLLMDKYIRSNDKKYKFSLKWEYKNVFYSYFNTPIQLSLL